MGLFDTKDMDDKTEFISGFTEKEFFEDLNFQRSHFDGIQRFHK